MDQSLAEYIKNANLEEHIDDKPNKEPEFRTKQQHFVCTAKHFEDSDDGGDDRMDGRRRTKHGITLDVNSDEEEEINQMYEELNKRVGTKIKPSNKVALSLSTNRNCVQDLRETLEKKSNKHRLITFNEGNGNNNEQNFLNSNDNNRRGGGNGNNNGGRFHPYQQRNNYNNNNNRNRNNNRNNGGNNFNGRGGGNNNHNNGQSNQFNGFPNSNNYNNNMNGMNIQQQQQLQLQHLQQQQQQQRNDLFNTPSSSSSTLIPSLTGLNNSNMNGALNILNPQPMKILNLIQLPNGQFLDLNGPNNNIPINGNLLNTNLNAMNLSTNNLQNMNLLGTNGLGNVLNLNGAGLPVVGIGNAAPMLALSNNGTLGLTTTSNLPLCNTNNLGGLVTSSSMTMSNNNNLQRRSTASSTLTSSSSSAAAAAAAASSSNSIKEKSQTLGSMLGITQDQINDQTAGQLINVMKAIINKEVTFKIVPN